MSLARLGTPTLHEIIECSNNFCVLCSFRRCLQTAAVAARALGVSDIKVDLRLAETDVAVRRDFQKANVPYSPSKHTHISYEDAANLLGPEQTLEWDGSQMDG